MISLQVYAKGLREADLVIRLGHALETQAGVRYKVDRNHDMVYFDFDEPTMNITQVARLFKDTGLEPRFVGVVPPELDEPTPSTERISIQ